jgi:hypothetical protein
MCSCVSVMDSWCRQRRGCACFPGCAVATPRTVVPSQGQCIPRIARATFGAPRRCDALRFLLPLQAVKKTAISQKAQRGRATSVASRHTGCWHTRCRQSTMPRFHGTACSEARCIPEATSQRHPAACYAQPTLALHRIRKAPGICRSWDVRASSGRDREVGDVRACDFLKRRRSPCPAPHGCAYCLYAWIGAVDPDTRPSSIARPPSPSVQAT